MEWFNINKIKLLPNGIISLVLNVEIFGSWEYSLTYFLIWHKTFIMDFCPKAPTPTALKQPTHTQKITHQQCSVSCANWKQIENTKTAHDNTVQYTCLLFLRMLNRLQTTVNDVYQTIMINLWHEKFWLMAFRWWRSFWHRKVFRGWRWPLNIASGLLVPDAPGTYPHEND